MSRDGPSPMQKVVFSSAELPAHLDDRARFSQWRDIYTTRYGLLDIHPSDVRPFSAHFEFAQFAGLGLGQFKGAVSRIGRTRREVAKSPSDNFCLVVNRGGSRMTFAHRGREGPLALGAATLFNEAEPGALCGAAENAWFAVVVPRKDLLGLVGNAEDLTGRPHDRSLPALLHLRRYLDMLVELDGASDDPALRRHAGTTLFDLIALVLGATGEGAETARMRGLRAARLQDIRTEIKLGFADAAFTVQVLAARLGLSPRYVQDLLFEAGASFTERMLELRMQKARAMLADPRLDRLKVSDIAYACGFNEASYFDRCFRRRFGASPREYRRGGGGADIG